MKTIKTPTLAESITEGVLGTWEKKVGAYVARDEVVANIETDKITLPVNSPDAGVIVEHCVKEGDTVTVGSELFKIDTEGKPSAEEPKKGAEKTHEEKSVQSKKEEKATFSSPPPPTPKSTPLKQAEDTKPATPSKTATTTTSSSKTTDEKKTTMSRESSSTAFVRNDPRVCYSTIAYYIM